MTPRPARKRLWRKRLTRAILCLLLGAVTTVGVAWGFALAPPPPPRRLAGAVAPRPWPLPVPRDWVPQAAVIQSETIGCTHVDAIWFDYPPTRRAHINSGRVPVYYQVGFSSGWPMRCLYSQRHTSAISARFVAPMLWPPVRFRDGIGLPWNQRILPVVPLWRGLLTNVLLYAAACWLVLFAPNVVRRFRRRRRGRCIHCGYDMAGLPATDNATPTCPECGQPAPRQR